MIMPKATAQYQPENSLGIKRTKDA